MAGVVEDEAGVRDEEEAEAEQPVEHSLNRV